MKPKAKDSGSGYVVTRTLSPLPAHEPPNSLSAALLLGLDGVEYFDQPEGPNDLSVLKEEALVFEQFDRPYVAKSFQEIEDCLTYCGTHADELAKVRNPHKPPPVKMDELVGRSYSEIALHVVQKYREIFVGFNAVVGGIAGDLVAPWITRGPWIADGPLDVKAIAIGDLGIFWRSVKKKAEKNALVVNLDELRIGVEEEWPAAEIDHVHIETTRFSPPPCKHCGGKTKVTSKQGRTRHLKCKKCEKTSKVTIK